MLRGRFSCSTAMQHQHPPRSKSPRIRPVQPPVLHSSYQPYMLHHIGKYPVLMKNDPDRAGTHKSSSRPNRPDRAFNYSARLGISCAHVESYTL